MHYATCLEVQWGWIAFPALLALYALALLLGVVVTTIEGETPIWKHSPLAWLFQTPEGFGENESYEKITAMEEKTKKIMISLAQGLG